MNTSEKFVSIKILLHLLSYLSGIFFERQHSYKTSHCSSKAGTHLNCIEFKGWNASILSWTVGLRFHWLGWKFRTISRCVLSTCEDKGHSLYNPHLFPLKTWTKLPEHLLKCWDELGRWSSHWTLSHGLLTVPMQAFSHSFYPSTAICDCLNYF